MCRNLGTFLVVKHTLIGAIFLGNIHIIAIGYIAMQTRQICIIVNGSFSGNGECRCANISKTLHYLSAKNAPSPIQE
jgi:hypothetical protein